MRNLLVTRMLWESYLIAYKFVDVREVIIEYIPKARTGVNAYSIRIKV